jgi:SAM-dependent methyltransferase
VRFLQAACERLPFADGSFDLVTAFEVIEHVERWQEMLTEALRVLKSSGVLMVSTPNKAYYAESRGEAGPNPFHCHEFEYEEFRSALGAVFPHVRMWTQNHAEAIVFAPSHPAGATLEAGGDAAPEQAHFFFAACSRSPLAANQVYAWMPASANLLRERERHISKLEGELRKKDAWLRQSVENNAELQRAHEETLAELRRQNEWAERLNRELAEQSARMLAWIHDLEARIERGDREIERLHAEREQLEADLRAQIERGRFEIVRLNAHREELEADLAARAAWGQALDAQLGECAREVLDLRDQLDRLHEERRLIADSRWVRLGRKLNVGPDVNVRGADGE